MSSSARKHVRWLKAALSDLMEIVDYIAKHDAQAAQRFAERVFDRVELLAESPDRAALPEASHNRMPRFVVLTHDHPFLHWDLMLEAGSALRTWRLLEQPDAGGIVAAEPLPDHRLDYLTYEGPVSGNRGEVRRWDAGEYVLNADSATRLEIRLDGSRLRGRGVLDLSKVPARWTFSPT